MSSIHDLTTVVGETVVTGSRLLEGAKVAINGATMEGAEASIPTLPNTGSPMFANHISGDGTPRIVHVGSAHPAETVSGDVPV